MNLDLINVKICEVDKSNGFNNFSVAKHLQRHAVLLSKRKNKLNQQAHITTYELINRLCDRCSKLL